MSFLRHNFNTWGRSISNEIALMYSLKRSSRWRWCWCTLQDSSRCRWLDSTRIFSLISVFFVTFLLLQTHVCSLSKALSTFKSRSGRMWYFWFGECWGRTIVFLKAEALCGLCKARRYRLEGHFWKSGQSLISANKKYLISCTGS